MGDLLEESMDVMSILDSKHSEFSVTIIEQSTTISYSMNELKCEYFLVF